MFGALVGGVLVSLVIAYLLIKYSSLHVRFSQDVPDVGPQKFHAAPTPRIGGVSVLVAVVVAAMIAYGLDESIFALSILLVCCALCAFIGGLAEDVTKQVPVRLRLLLTFVSAGLAFFFLDARITALDIPWIDRALGFSAVSFAFTLFAVGGFAQATNIVDGFNGLAGVVSLIFLAAIAFVADRVGDQAIMWTALLCGGAIVGFLAFNFPRGLIFLGDGGAYMIGFLIAELAVLLVHRNSEVSPWFALALLSYPVVEVMFSIYRKRVLRGQSAGDPDALHLHMLIHKRWVRRYRARPRSTPDNWANPLTAPFLWILALLPAIPAVLFWNQTWPLQATVVAFATLYVWIYWRIVRFRSPKLLRFRRKSAPNIEEITFISGRE